MPARARATAVTRAPLVLPLPVPVGAGTEAPLLEPDGDVHACAALLPSPPRRVAASGSTGRACSSAAAPGPPPGPLARLASLARLAQIARLARLARLAEIARSFGGHVRSEPRCAACGWRFERCPGHWVGGNEINVVLSFSVGVATWLAAVIALGRLDLAPVLVATAATATFSVAFYPRSRSLFFALDYLIDPAPDPVEGPWFLADDDDVGGDAGPDAPRGPTEPPSLQVTNQPPPPVPRRG